MPHYNSVVINFQESFREFQEAYYARLTESEKRLFNRYLSGPIESFITEVEHLVDDGVGDFQQFNPDEE